MAQLTDDRGQMILIAAFALAAIFIALAIITNAAIYTQSLASRGDTTGTGDALQMRDEVEQTVGTVVALANDESHSLYTDRVTSLQNSLQELETHLGREIAISESTVLSLTYDSDIEGRKVVDDTPGELLDSDGDEDWILAREVGDPDSGPPHSRAFRFDLDPASLDGQLGDGVNDEFVVEFEEVGSGDTYEVHVGTISGDPAVRVTQGGTVLGICRPAVVTGRFSLDVSEGVLEGEECDAIDEIWRNIDDDEEYDIRFVNGDAAEGTYSLIFYRSSSVPSITTTCSPLSASPCENHAIYSTMITYEYLTPTVTYTTDVRVAPGEPDE